LEETKNNDESDADEIALERFVNYSTKEGIFRKISSHPLLWDKRGKHYHFRENTRRRRISLVDLTRICGKDIL